ncbi:tetratricopeptide repeat protein [Shewanella corallii]|uniref:Tetratricopeptide repeat protein n=1 Tax=Shewanella corallii TaxID=560080 RepID=A0ABT0N624_9GAMM|nr:tetratricopeptide repeat protein [Shewanella corallii]MCL2913868.1 tetratricopeptide repeat protein [Shewanella corallii]
MAKFLIPLLMLIFMQGCSSAPPPHKGNKDIMTIQAQAEQAYRRAMLDQAESLYLEVLNSVPNYAPAWFRLGNIYTRTGRQEAAIAAYQRCLELEPNNQKAWYNMSLVRLKQSTQLLQEASGRGDQKSAVHQQIEALLSELTQLQSATRGS